MQTNRLIIAFVFGTTLLQVAPAAAARRSHKPWLSHKAISPDSDSTARMTAAVTEATTPSKRTPGTKVVHQALSYKGTRYRFGGTTKKGMDCSGLVARVWADLNMKKVPRASSALYKSGTPVHLAELQPGDLVFFKNTYKTGISHVGVYTGNNKFVHASGRRKGVTITKLSDPYFQLHYAGARRLY